MTEQILVGPDTFEMPLIHSAFTPFYNLWGHNSYFHRQPFSVDINEVDATSTSGSPVVATEFRMAGFLTSAGGRVSLEGGKIRCEIPEGQKVVVLEGGTEREQHNRYLELVEAPAPEPSPVQPHWLLPEYVTWVEQKDVAAKTKTPPPSCLDEASVKDFVRRVKALGLPQGKLTIDDGWQGGGTPRIDGHWNVDTAKFPDMPGLVHWIEDEGFVPSLWFGLPRVGRGAPILKDRPELFEGLVDTGAEEAGQAKGMYYHHPSPELTDFYREIFARYIGMGFRKFKLDFYYGPRQLMAGLIQCAYEAIKSVDPTVEVESHHPDVFFSRWVDAVRVNDVNIQNGWDWQGLTLAHLRVCELCAPDKVINIDHAGGNEPKVCEADFIRHLSLFHGYTDVVRYPVVSLLPDRFSDAAVIALKEYLHRHTIKLGE
jgi:hypothetical protein